MADYEHRIPITSRSWFFPALIIATPVVARLILGSFSSAPRPASHADAQYCADQYEQCSATCSSDDTDTGGETGAGEDQACLDACGSQLDACLASVSSESSSSPSLCSGCDDPFACDLYADDAGQGTEGATEGADASEPPLDLPNP